MKQYLKKFEEQVHSRAGQPALCDFRGSSYTYGEVAALIAKLHLLFEAAGIRKGDKIALMAKESARWGIFFLGVNSYEGIIVPLLPNFTPEGATHLINHSDSIVLVADPDIWEKLDPGNLPQIRAVLNAKEEGLLWGDEAFQAAWAKRDALFSEKYPEGFDPQCVSYHDHADQLAVINYTSGTSGDPKGVMLSFGAFSDIVQYCQDHIYNSPEGLVSMLPLAHIYGLVMEFLYPCCTGFTIHFLGKAPSPSLLMEAMQMIKPTLVITVPLVMEKLNKFIVQPLLDSISGKVLSSFPGIRLSFYKTVGEKVISNLGGRIKAIIIGGAPLDWKVESIFRKIGLPYAVGYGMTEASPLLSFVMPENFVAGSCGKPVHEIRIVSSDPERVPGEIQSRGPNLTMGYYKNPEADASAWTPDGWFRTGDLGVMDEEGNLFIRGRIKALILSASGQNIYPEEVEQVLSRDPVVQESLVLQRDDKIVALVYARPEVLAKIDTDGQSQFLLEIRDRANKHLPPFSRIFYVELMDVPFERTAKGNIKRQLYQ